MNAILIGVITCAKDEAWYSACKDTWLKQLPIEMATVKVDASFLPTGMPDTRENLPHKTKALAAYAFKWGYRNLLKIDCDSYCRLHMLKLPTSEYAGRLRGRSSPDEVPCKQCGRIPPVHENDPRCRGYDPVQNDAEYVSGGAYWLRGSAIQIVARAEVTRDPAEDRWVGNTLLEARIKPEPIPTFIAPTHVPCTDYLKSANTVVLMQMREYNEEHDPGGELSIKQMRDAHVGKFPPPVPPSGSRPEHYPPGSVLRAQMIRQGRYNR